MPDLELMPEDDYAPIRHALLGDVGVLVGVGEITPEEAARYVDMLDLDPQPEPAPTREPGLRAVPVDWTRRGAVGA